jgi:hypothetical protein
VKVVGVELVGGMALSRGRDREQADGARPRWETRVREGASECLAHRARLARLRQAVGPGAGARTRSVARAKRADGVG